LAQSARERTIVTKGIVGDEDIKVEINERDRIEKVCEQHRHDLLKIRSRSLPN